MDAKEMRCDAQVGTVPRIFAVVRPARGDVVGSPDVLFGERRVGHGCRDDKITSGIERRRWWDRRLRLRVRREPQNKQAQKYDLSWISHEQRCSNSIANCKRVAYNV